MIPLDEYKESLVGCLITMEQSWISLNPKNNPYMLVISSQIIRKHRYAYDLTVYDFDSHRIASYQFDNRIRVVT